MLYPTIGELTKGDFNRYELSLATARCARLVTDEYVKQREDAERAQTGNKETDKPINALINKELRDEKAVKTAIRRIHDGEYVIVRRPEGYFEEQESKEEADFEAPIDLKKILQEVDEDEADTEEPEISSEEI
jgi:DNA-directed RNA polymerase subunit K/omega